MRFLVGIPVLLSAASFVLAMLALFAGKSPGFMEEFHIIMFNTSELGHVLVPTTTTGSTQSTTTTGGGGAVGGFFSSLVADATSAVAAAESQLAGLEGDVADKLAGELGIKQFYSLHALDMCEGTFKPNATAPHAGYNVTNCTHPLDTSYMNISARLDHELDVGPLHLNLADLGFTRDLQHQLDKVPPLLRALGALFITGAALAGLALVCALAALVALPPAPDPQRRRRRGWALLLGNLVVASLGAAVLLAGGVATTVGGRKAAHEVTDKGRGIGLSARRGGRFVALVWAAFAALAACGAYWAAEVVRQRRAGRRGAGGLGKREHDRYSMESDSRERR